MSVTIATAPGKIILFGEHAVVYGRPAIAAPVTQVRATAAVEPNPAKGVRLRAPDLSRDYGLDDAPIDDPFARAVQVVIDASGPLPRPNLIVSVSSTIPIASGLGSGAAMAAAVIRAIAHHLGRPDLADDGRVSAMTYEVERLLHGTPSGIDNTVVSYEQPVYFVRRQPQNLIETIKPATPLRFLVADTGVTSMTRDVVGDVRRQWLAQPGAFEEIFDGCGRIAVAARQAIEAGQIERLGQLMRENQDYLRRMTVSCPELETLVAAAGGAGAWGAKLSGAGRGGNMIALVSEESEGAVRGALLSAGARAVFTSLVG